MRAVALASLLIAIAACNEDRALPPGDSDGSATASDGSAGSGDGSSVVDAAAPDLTNPTVCPASDPARASVSFGVKNGTASDVYLAVPSASFPRPCEQFAVADASGHALPLTLGYQCGCECPAPPAARTDRYLVIHPGGTILLGAWDGKSVAGCPMTIDCSMFGGPGQMATVYSPYYVDAPPGDYTLTVAYETAPPPGCQPANSMPDTWFCPTGPGMPASGSYLALCPSTLTASVKATLLPSGDMNALIVIQ